MCRALAPLILVAGALSSCASDPMPEIRGAWARGEYPRARDMLAELESSDPSNRHLYSLERSMTELSLGQPKAAEEALRSARNRFEELGGHGALEWFGAVMLDDRQLDYLGADFELVLVRAMLAVSNLMGDGGDVQAYALQVLERQRALIDAFERDGSNPKEQYKLVAFGSYLRGITSEDDPLKLGVAGEAFGRVVEIEPRCRLGAEALQRVTDGQHSAKGNGVVHVICLVGRGPARFPSNEPVSRAALTIAQVIWSISRDRNVFPNITDIDIPALAFARDNPTEVHVEVNGDAIGRTEVVTDVEETASREFDAMHDHIVARAVLRRAFKIVVTEGVREAVNPKDDRDRHRRSMNSTDWTDLAISLGGMLWTGLEQADLRCWSLLPASFQATRFELPVGEHEITLRAGRGGAAMGAPQTLRVTVRDGFNSYVVGIVPTLAGGPPPLTSEPAYTADSTP